MASVSLIELDYAGFKSRRTLSDIYSNLLYLQHLVMILFSYNAVHVLGFPRGVFSKQIKWLAFY